MLLPAQLWHFIEESSRIRLRAYDNLHAQLTDYLQLALGFTDMTFACLCVLEETELLPFAEAGIQPEAAEADLITTLRQAALQTRTPKVYGPQGQAVALQQPIMAMTAPLWHEQKLFGVVVCARPSATAVPLAAETLRMAHVLLQDAQQAIATRLSQQRRNRLETTLLASKDQFRILVNNLPGAVYRIKVLAPGINMVEYLSPYITLLLGLPPEDFINACAKNLWAHAHPADRAHLEAAWPERLRQQASYRDEFRLYHQKGHFVWVRDYGQVSRDEQGVLRIEGVIMDITERKEAEAEANKQRLIFRAMLEAQHDAMLAEDAHRKIVYINSAARKLFGYPDQEVIGQHIDSFFDRLTVPPEPHHRLHLGECYLRDVHGHAHLCEVQSSPLLEQQKAAGFLTIIRNITVQRRTEEQLVLLSEALESSTNGIVISDPALPNMPIIYVNPAFERMTGYRREEVIGRNCRFLQGTDQQQPELDRLRQALRERTNCNVFLRNYRKDGTLFYNQLDISPVFNKDGQLTHYLGIQSDITERIRVERAYRYLAEIVESSEDAIMGQDLGGALVSWNGGAEAIYGYTAEEIIGQPVETIVPPDRHGELATFMEKIRHGEHITHYETVRLTKGERLIDVSLTISPILDEQGCVKGASTIARDITERKRMIELERARDLAERALQLKSRFMANMSHEIRTPLNGLIGMADILHGTPLATSQREYVEIIKKSSENLLTIINDILDFSKLEAGKMQFNASTFHLHQTLHRVQDLFIPLVRHKDLAFTLDIATEVPPLVHTDETKLVQILTNLVSNAIKFTERGQVTIRVQSQGANQLRFEVQDTGPGITADQQTQLFQQFSQLDTSLTRQNGGTGLGLVICRSLVRLFEGEIDVVSTEGQGSLFWFTIRYALPAPLVHSSALVQTTPVVWAAAFNAHVLLVEDQEVNQFVARLMLEKAGCRITIAQDGQEACDVYCPGTFDLILMDIRMPVMDGITATQQLRAQHTDLPPIVGMSADAMSGDAERYIEAGLDDYLAKPVTYQMLVEKLSQWLPALRVATTAPEACPLGPENHFLDETVLAQIEQMAQQHPEAVADLFRSFIEDCQELIVQLAAAHQAHDVERMRHAAHTLKGLSGTLGATELFRLCDQLNTRLRLEDYTVGLLLDQLKTHNQQLTAYLQKRYHLIPTAVG